MPLVRRKDDEVDPRRSTDGRGELSAAKNRARGARLGKRPRSEPRTKKGILAENAINSTGGAIGQPPATRGSPIPPLREGRSRLTLSGTCHLLRKGHRLDDREEKLVTLVT